MRSFQAKYQGDAVTVFLKSLKSVYEENYNSVAHYGRTIPILQSSGTGKSRLVKEIGNTVRRISP